MLCQIISASVPSGDAALIILAPQNKACLTSCNSPEKEVQSSIMRSICKKHTLMRPLSPCFVHSSSGLNHRTSSGWWNIHRTTAFFLCTLTGYPERTILFKMTLSGLQLLKLPAGICLNASVSLSEHELFLLANGNRDSIEP